MTRLGFRVFLAAGLAFFGSVTSGNNLLYLIDGMIVAILAVSFVMNRLNLSQLSIHLDFPEQIFQNAEFPLSVSVRNRKSFASFQVAMATDERRRFLSCIKRHQTAVLSIGCLLIHRGRNRLSDLFLESSFPFGFFRRRKKIPDCTGLAFPAVSEIQSPQMSPAVSEEQVSLPKRGVGDEFYGLREYAEGEDARLINWKLTAKTGRPLVKEYAQQIGNKITITADGTPGPDTESNISEAASAAKYFIDSGAEVRLVTNEGDIGYDKGLLHLDRILKKLALLGEGKNIKGRVLQRRPRHPRPEFNRAKSILGIAYLTTAVVYASLFLVEELSPAFFFLFALILPWGWFFDKKKFYPVPKAVFDAASWLVLLFIVFIDLGASGILLAETHLILYILIYLLFNPKSERRLQQLFLTNFLIFFLVSGQAVSLWYFVFFLGFFITAGIWLIHGQEPGRISFSLRPSWLGSLFSIVALSSLLAAALFIVLPRIYSPRMQQILASAGLSRFQSNVRTFSGLTDWVELGYMGPLKKNSARVMRVNLESPAGTSPSPSALYIRGGAFDFFDGRRWRKTPLDFRYAYSDRVLSTRRGQAWMRRARGKIYSQNYDPKKPTFVTEFMIYPLLNTALVFSVGGISAVESDVPSAFFDFTETAYFPSAYNEGIHYRIFSQTENPSFFQQIEDYGRILKEKFLALPAAEEKFRRLAHDLTQTSPDPYLKARTLESHFKNNFSYSVSAASGRQDLNAFLFKSRAGNCEYFATAMCVLLRNLDIPSRLVIGFLSQEWNAYGRFYDVRQCDAHAWVEAFFPDRGWIAFDPTPPDLTLHGGTNILAVLWGKLNQYFNALQFRWYRYVVGYDTDTQRNFFYNFRLPGRLWTIMIIMIGTVGLAFIFVLWKPRRFLKIRRRGALEQENFYDILLSRLEKAGYRRRPWQTGYEFAEELIGLEAGLQPIMLLTDYFYSIRYAGRSLSAEDGAIIQQLLKNIQSLLAVSAKKKNIRR